MDHSEEPPTTDTVPAVTSDPQPAIKRGWVRALLMVPTWLIGVIVAGIIGAVGSGVTSTEDLEAMTNTPLGLLFSTIQLLFAILPVYLFRRFIDCRSFRSLGFQFDRSYRCDLLVGIAMGIGLIGLVFILLLLTDNITLTTVQMPGIGFVYAIVVMMMVGVGEELVMRGYIQSNLMQSMNKYTALLVTSLLFAVVHALNPNASLMGLVNIILAGLLLGIYYVHKRNLWLPIGMHFSWNLFQGSVFGSQVSGVTTESVFSFDTVGSDLITGGSFGFEASIVTTGVMIAAIAALHLIYRPRKSLNPARPN